MPDRKKMIAGIIILSIGILMILVSALNYFFKWGELTIPYVTIGIAIAAIGAGIIMKSK